jgi:hypothetical protein
VFVNPKHIATPLRPTAGASYAVYQDKDPLGKDQWFGYVHASGHILRNFGPYPTKARALKIGAGMVARAKAGRKL